MSFKFVTKSEIEAGLPQAECNVLKVVSLARL